MQRTLVHCQPCLTSACKCVMHNTYVWNIESGLGDILCMAAQLQQVLLCLNPSPCADAVAAASLTPLLSTLSANAEAYGIPAECLANTTTQLGVCVSDIGLLEGCCSTSCYGTINVRLSLWGRASIVLFDCLSCTSASWRAAAPPPGMAP
mmetsp:Transcript_8689/g.26374  ORF Transcript_8689/g.26374 Transcript_8689/m.26374 type:complete len:150 (-) Transcript_8689:220-669(-)|eukprot:351579-Chlamydomonas_euryale.AAC.1